MSEPQLTELGKAMAELREEDVEKLVFRYIDEGRPPLTIIDELSAGMDVVGSLFKQGEYYLSELVFSGEIFKHSMARLKPIIDAAGGRECVGKVVLGTVKGDIHDLGKDIVATLLECAGFEVVSHSGRETQARLLGRVPRPMVPGWLIIVRHLLMQSGSQGWTVDISKQYFLRGGKVMYGWRLIFQGPMADHLHHVVQLVAV